MAPRVLIVTAFQLDDPLKKGLGEATAWVQQDQLLQLTDIPGVSSPLYCNAGADECLIITGVGTANATANMMALGMSDRVDLSRTYVLFAGIGGTPPDRGTIGTAVWADYVVSANLADEIDAREMPPDWQFSKMQLNCPETWCDPPYRSGAEVFELNPALVEWAYRLSKDTPLADDASTQSYRALYPEGLPARRAPFVMTGGILSDSTFWHGKLLSDWAAWWVNQWTGGKSQYSMVAVEETGILAALSHLQRAGRADYNRALVLRTASNFDQQHPGQTAQESFKAALTGVTGGLTPALDNAYRAGSAVARHILTSWPAWEQGIPALPAGPPATATVQPASPAPAPTQPASPDASATEPPPARRISAAYFGIFDGAYLAAMAQPEQIPWQKIDRLYIAFATLNADGQLTNIEVDNSADEADARIRAVVGAYRSANPEGQVFIASNFGDEMDGRYQRAAQDPARFAGGVLAYLQRYDLDGYDMDWESRQINDYALDLKALLDACRAAFQAAGPTARDGLYQVTHTIWPGVHSPETVASLKDSVDAINLMTYGAGDDYALDVYAAQYRQAGFPYEKMLAGVESEFGYPENGGQDTQESIAAKAAFVQQNNLAGLFSWRLDNDMRTADGVTEGGPPTFRVAEWVASALYSPR